MMAMTMTTTMLIIFSDFKMHQMINHNECFNKLFLNVLENSKSSQVISISAIRYSLVNSICYFQFIARSNISSK